MKKILQSVLYLIIVILMLEVFKTVVVKKGGDASFFIGNVIASLQMFILTGFVLFSLIYKWRKKRTANTRKAFGLALAASVIIIGCLEGGCMLLLHHPDRLPSFMHEAYDYYYNTYDRRIIQLDSNSSVYDPKLFYTLKPNARFNYSNVEFNNLFTTNRFGVRDDERSVDKPAVICLGDSFGMGWGADQDSTYSQQLEQLSGKIVLNAGVSSYGTAREIINLGRFDTSALTYLVVQYCDNDFEENTQYLDNKYVLKISSQQVYNTAVKSEAISKTYYPGKHFLTIAQLFIKQSVNKVVPVFSFNAGNDNKRVANDGMQARSFLDVFSRAPVNFSTVKTIVLYPDKDTAKCNAFERITDSLLQVSPYKECFHNHIKILKTAEILQPADYYILDAHLKNAGHRKVAQALWKMMQTF